MSEGKQAAQHAPLCLGRFSDGSCAKESKRCKGSNAPTAHRRLAGARAQGLGAAFETWLARYIFTPMTARGALVRFDKLDPPSRPSWDACRQRAVMVPIGVGGGDWLLLAPGDRYIVCESKSTADARFYRAEVEPHQVTRLDQAVNAGGAAYLALQFRTGGSSTAYLVPWALVPWQTARTAASVTAADCAPWPLRSWIDGAKVLSSNPESRPEQRHNPQPEQGDQDP